MRSAVAAALYLALACSGAQAFHPSVVTPSTCPARQAGSCVAWLHLLPRAEWSALGASEDGGEVAESRHTSQQQEALQSLSWLRKSTDGNGLSYDGQTVDTPEYRALWAQHTDKILAALPEADTSDGDLAQAYTEAVMYRTSSKGIIKSIASGNAFTFLSAVDRLVTQHPQQDNGVAYIFQGAYYLAAPWPVRSAKKAVDCFDKALAIKPNSRRNLYYAGVAALAAGNKPRARDFFTRAAAAPCASATEEDIGAFLEAQAKLAIASL